MEATCGPAAPFPTDPYPPVEFVKINITGEHKQPGGDQLLAAPDSGGEPGPGDCASTFDPDVIAALGHLAKMIDQRLARAAAR